MGNETFKETQILKFGSTVRRAGKWGNRTQDSAASNFERQLRLPGERHLADYLSKFKQALRFASASNQE